MSWHEAGGSHGSADRGGALVEDGVPGAVQHESRDGLRNQNVNLYPKVGRGRGETVGMEGGISRYKVRKGGREYWREDVRVRVGERE